MENALWNGERLLACEVAGDYYTEKKIRKASYQGELRCPDPECKSPILKYCHGEIREPYFAHRDKEECDYVFFERDNGVFHGLRLALYEHLRAFGYDVQMEAKVLKHHYSQLLFTWRDGSRTAVELGTKATNLKDVERINAEYEQGGIEVLWLVVDQPGKSVQEEHTYFLKRFCLNESVNGDLFVLGYDGKSVTQYREDPNVYEIDGKEVVLEEYPDIYECRGYVKDLLFEDGQLKLCGFEEAFEDFLEAKREAFWAYQDMLEQEKADLLRQYEILTMDREIKDNRLYAETSGSDDYESRKQSVLPFMGQQERPVLDAYGNRWAKCEVCGEIKEVAEFASFGGKGRVNIGRCEVCNRNGKVTLT